jgi:hypothetical protein
MRAIIRKFNQTLHCCDAVSEDHMLIIFRPPEFGLHIGDVIEFDPELLDKPQIASNITTGGSFSVEIWQSNVHGLRVRTEQGAIL